MSLVNDAVVAGIIETYAPDENPNRTANVIRPASDLHMGMKRKMRRPDMKH